MTENTQKEALRFLLVTLITLALITFSIYYIAESASEFARGDRASGLANGLIALGSIKLIFSI